MISQKKSAPTDSGLRLRRIRCPPPAKQRARVFRCAFHRKNIVHYRLLACILEEFLGRGFPRGNRFQKRSAPLQEINTKRSAYRDVNGGRTFGSIFDVICHPVAIPQAFKTACVYGRMMDKEIRSCFLFDKTETFFSSNHFTMPLAITTPSFHEVSIQINQRAFPYFGRVA